MMKKIVLFTGAGISRESGLPTFRGEGGIWNTIDYAGVASIHSWRGRGPGDLKQRRQAMLDFFNPLRRMIMSHEPNEAHYIIAEMEKYYDVTVITQNGDDYHTRAGSSNVIYLHGEALKNASSARPYTPIPIDMQHPDIAIGDKASDGSQLRPFIIYFDEDIDYRLWKRAVVATRSADWFVVVGSSMVVYPAAALLEEVSDNSWIVIIDPEKPHLPDNFKLPFMHIRNTASRGLKELSRLLK